MLVRFLRAWRMYNRGEVASFAPAFACELIEGGFAVDATLDAAQGDEPDAASAVEPNPSADPAPGDEPDAAEPVMRSASAKPKR